MKVLILAAGRGSRLGEHTDHLPKGFVELAGKPLLHHQIQALRQGGIKEIGIVTGYCAEAFQSFEAEGLACFHNAQWQESNMVASLYSARNWLNDSCLIAYADILYESQLVNELQRALTQSQADFILPINLNWRALWEARFEDPLEDAESLKMNATGQVIEIGARAQSLNEIEGQFMGLLLLRPKGIQSLLAYLKQLSPETRARLDMTSLLQQLISKDIPIAAYPSESDWLELDTREDLSLYQAWHRAGKLKKLLEPYQAPKETHNETR